jgi:hypothetical protein
MFVVPQRVEMDWKSTQISLKPKKRRDWESRIEQFVLVLNDAK